MAASDWLTLAFIALVGLAIWRGVRNGKANRAKAIADAKAEARAELHAELASLSAASVNVVNLNRNGGRGPAGVNDDDELAACLAVLGQLLAVRGRELTDADGVGGLRASAGRELDASRFSLVSRGDRDAADGADRPSGPEALTA